MARCVLSLIEVQCNRIKFPNDTIDFLQLMNWNQINTKRFAVTSYYVKMKVTSMNRMNRAAPPTKKAKHLCNMCFCVSLAMSVSFSFQISNSPFFLNIVRKSQRWETPVRTMNMSIKKFTLMTSVPHNL